MRTRAQGVVADVHQPTVCDVVVDGARVSNVAQAQLETVRDHYNALQGIMLSCISHVMRRLALCFCPRHQCSS